MDSFDLEKDLKGGEHPLMFKYASHSAPAVTFSLGTLLKLEPNQ